MSVVSNAGPLIALARIARLELLHELYGEVLIPVAVRDEVMVEAKMSGAQELASAAWLRVMEVADRQAVDVLQLTLDKGESEAIVLARTLGKVLLIDEKRGRAVAAALAMPRTGTIGMLLAAKDGGLVDNVRRALDELFSWTPKPGQCRALRKDGPTMSARAGHLQGPLRLQARRTPALTLAEEDDHVLLSPGTDGTDRVLW